jgi:NAD(P)-dependent dehydrogenase (short-subunit alcohol dehydrogenase family)
MAVVGVSGMLDRRGAGLSTAQINGGSGMARVAIVTGGASGIGRALSAALVGRGDHVVLADIDADAATAVAERLSGQGPGTASAVQVDVRDAAGVAGGDRDRAAARSAGPDGQQRRHRNRRGR